MRTLIGLLMLIFCLATSQLFSNGTSPKKKIIAERIFENLRIDGQMNESSWDTAPIASEFTQLKPNPGVPSAVKTEVKILYDDFAVYVGAKLYLNEGSKVAHQFFERDNLGNNIETDWFGVGFDTYMDGINGSGFVVGASGGQMDLKFSSDGDDTSWDAVWDAAVQIHDGYWIVEMKIPYSALRFPDKDEQTWHVQFVRNTFHLQEEAFWNEMDPQVDGFFTQAGILEGIKNVKSPVRLAATPFLALYAENYYDRNATSGSSWGRSFNGGMDIKYGINDAFTLDMTLIPDFGQVRSDNEILNLSPFEVQFDENRQFFTEGVELFSKANLFYSRRVGGAPFRYDEVGDQLRDGEKIISNPSETGLINATKISGRTNARTGFGFFNAIAGREIATIENLEGKQRTFESNPLTNYNVFVVDQALKNNSYVSLINTNVLRSGSARDANVTGTEFEIRNKQNSYALQGSGAVSQLFYSDRVHSGFKYNVEIEKISGNWQWNIGHYVDSDTYDPNDLGFITNNNEIGFNGRLSYSQYEPFGAFLRMGGGIFAKTQSLYRFPTTERSQLRKNLFVTTGINAWWWATTKNLLSLEVWTYIQPGESFNYFEPRVPGRFYIQPRYYNFGADFESDNRKKLSLEGGLRYFFAGDRENRLAYELELNPSFRFNDKFSASLSAELESERNAEGYVTDFGDDDIIMGRRNIVSVNNVLRANYNFTATTTISFRLRHNWTQVKYNSFHFLEINGYLSDSEYAENEDLTFNAFTIDAVYRWRFAPGSDIFLVWKNSIFGLEEDAKLNYFENYADLFNNPQRNSFSVKVLYYLDYLNVKNLLNKEKPAFEVG